MTETVVVGNGLAAHRLVQRLRGDHVTVLGAENRPAYNRTLLTSMLSGRLPPDAITLPEHPAGTRVRLGVTVTAIDRARRTVRTSDRREYRYDRLVLATGARRRVPALPGVILGGLDDLDRIGPGSIAVVGGGPLGVQTAAALLRSRTRVTLVHQHSRLMNRLLDPVAGDLLAARLTDLGADLRLRRTAVAREPGKLILDDGQVIAADTVLLCTGADPETGLARRAGLAVRRGIVVDDRLRTSDPRIFAIGDCTHHPASADSAVAQADVLAEVLSGRPARYTPGPAIIRLNAAEIDLAVVGTLDLPGVERVVLSDPARCRYARLEIRDERISGAVLLGLPDAIAAVGWLYDRELPVPSARFGLLTGDTTTWTGPPDPLSLPGEALVCRCNTVTKRALVDSWHGGARDPGAVAAATRATTGCGGCQDLVRSMIAALERT